MRWIGNGIFAFTSRLQQRLKESFSRPEGTHGTDVLQGERKRKAALDAGADIELADLQTQAITRCIIANLGGRSLENRVLNIIRKDESRAEPLFQSVTVNE